MKGEELARAVRHLDRAREEEASSSRTTIFRRSSYGIPLPLPNSSDFFMAGGYSTSPQFLDVTGILLHSVPYISRSLTRPTSPVNNISQQRTLLRRPLRRVIVVWPHNDRRSPRRSFPIPKLTDPLKESATPEIDHVLFFSRFLLHRQSTCYLAAATLPCATSPIFIYAIPPLILI